MANSSPPMGLSFATGLRLFRMVRHLVPLFLLATVVSAVSVSVSYGRAKFVRDLLDHFSLDTFLRIGLNLLGLTLASAVLLYARTRFAQYLNLRIVCEVRDLLVAKLLRLPLRFFQRRSAGDTISRLSVDVAYMHPAVAFYFEDVWKISFQFAMAAGLAFYANWRLAALGLFAFPLLILPLRALGRKIWKHRSRSLVVHGQMTGSLVRISTDAKTIQVYQQQEAERRSFAGQNRRYLRNTMAALHAKALAESATEMFFAVLLVLVLGGIWFFYADAPADLTVGDLALFAFALGMISRTAEEATRSYNRLQDAMGAAQRVFQILDEQEDLTERTGEEEPGPAAELRFEAVSFAYEDCPVVHDISFEARAGELVAIVGRSGAGKSTLADLICRFYDPTEGRILLDGRDLRSLRKSSLLRRIALCTQDPCLFEGTIRDNVRYGKPDATDEEILEACRQAGLESFVSGRSGGLDSPVGEGGALLSGGERQRVALARALLRNPAILILDEPTSQLDPETRRTVLETIEKITRNGSSRRMTFLITHMLQDARGADRILVIDRGRLVEQGRHEDLLRRDGTYTLLFRSPEDRALHTEGQGGTSPRPAAHDTPVVS